MRCTPTARAAAARTRWSLLGFGPESMLGSVEDRNYSVHRGF